MDRVADLSQVPANPANDGIASAFGLNPMMRALSALDMLYNPEYRPEIPDRDTTEGLMARNAHRVEMLVRLGFHYRTKLVR